MMMITTTVIFVENEKRCIVYLYEHNLERRGSIEDFSIVIWYLS